MKEQSTFKQISNFLFILLFIIVGATLMIISAVYPGLKDDGEFGVGFVGFLTLFAAAVMVFQYLDD